MIATKEDVLAVAPCFSSLTDPQWEIHLALVAPFVPDDVWGSDPARARLPQALFAAHHLALIFPALAKAAFIVSSESVGAISRTYAVPSIAPGMLSLTRWGAQYKALARGLPSFFAV